MKRSLVGMTMIFLGYEDGFLGELSPGELVIVFSTDGEDAYRVHPIREGRADPLIFPTVFVNELGGRPLVVASK